MRSWLAIVYAMILAMVCIGGITRLTGSGLSMVEWHPLMGALPPLNEAAWNDAFTKYQQFPQYQQVNQWMTLADFKRIFFWEYTHRLWGRLIGLVAFVPWAVFVARGMERGLALRTLLLIVLGGLQGVLGWYMVKSGLVHQPEVSHFRLAAHLSLAFVVALYAQHLWLSVGGWRWRPRPLMLGALGLVGLQTVYGAFMAGTRAGWLAATFPSMHGHWLPTAFLEHGFFIDALHTPLIIHWIHRVLGVLVVLACLAVGRARGGKPVVVLVLLQFVLGALTVIYSVPTALAVVHQANALLLASALLWACHEPSR